MSICILIQTMRKSLFDNPGHRKMSLLPQQMRLLWSFGAGGNKCRVKWFWIASLGSSWSHAKKEFNPDHFVARAMKSGGKNYNISFNSITGGPQQSTFCRKVKWFFFTSKIALLPFNASVHLQLSNIFFVKIDMFYHDSSVVFGFILWDMK